MCADSGKNFKSKTKSVLEILPISWEGGRTYSPCSGSGCSNTCSVDGLRELIFAVTIVFYRLYYKFFVFDILNC